MSEPINDGGPAFPIADSHHANGQVQYGANGMTLRDWFAGQALAGLCSNELYIRSTKGYYPENNKDDWHVWYKTYSQAFEIADAMLAARERKDGDK